MAGRENLKHLARTARQKVLGIILDIANKYKGHAKYRYTIARKAKKKAQMQKCVNAKLSK